MSKDSPIVLLYGPPCGGKSTLSKKFASMYHFTLLSTDKIREEFFLDADDLFTEKDIERVYDKLFHQLDLCVQGGKPVMIEGMFLKKERRNYIISNYCLLDLKVVFVTASWDTIVSRLSMRSKTGNNVLHAKVPLSEDKLKQFYSAAAFPPDKGLIVDTTSSTIEESIVAIGKIIEKSYSCSFLKANFLNDGENNLLKQ